MVISKVVKEEGNSKNILAKIKSLLHEFKEIVVDDLPQELPPVRSISHQIDMIPSSSLPNKSPYRMTTTKSEEVNKQVQEFLNRGMIRESLSPCVVPTVLAPKKTGERRMCMAFQAINRITIKYKFHLPRMDDIMDCLSGVA